MFNKIWYHIQVVGESSVRAFLNAIPEEVALTAKVTFDRDNTNDYCSTWYHIFYLSSKEY